MTGSPDPFDPGRSSTSVGPGRQAEVAGSDRPEVAPGPAPELFQGVDRALFVATLVHRLRDAGTSRPPDASGPAGVAGGGRSGVAISSVAAGPAGVAVGPTAANRLARALDACRPTDVDTLYWVCRVSLLSDHRDVAAFDRVFAQVFDGLGLPIAPWLRRRPDEGRAVVRSEGSVRRSVPDVALATLSGRVTSTRPEVVDPDDEPDPGDPVDETPIPELLPAALGELADRPFDDLDADQIDRIGRWLSEAAADLPVRPGRRRQPAARGSIDLRRSLAGARATGEVITLARRRPRIESRPLVMVADVSGSMESFARIYLHLLRAFAQRSDVSGFEAFLFSTDLHRVTPALRQRDARSVIDRLSDEATDRFGGTRIATNLGRLLTSPRWSHAVREATVVIVSDGWDADEPELLARRMARLARTTHRVVWVNPRAGDPDWRPEVGGMAAALPHVDRLCSGHSLRAMGEVIRAITAPSTGFCLGFRSGAVERG